MNLQDVVRLFLDSRKRGTGGAKKKCTAATLAIYERNLEIFRTYLLEKHGILKYEDIRRLHIVQLLDHLESLETSGTWSKSSVLQFLRCLKTLFRWVSEDEDCQLHDLKGMQKYLPAIEQAPRRTDLPQKTDLKAFKDSYRLSNRWEYRDFVITCLMMDTGIRIGEVCNLRIDHLRLEERLMVVNGKTGPRPVPLTKEVVRLLKAWLKRRSSCQTAKESPYVFITKRAGKCSQQAMSTRFRRHYKKHNLPRITPHTFRHLFCTNFLAKGGDMEKLRSVTGHTTYGMLQGYLHMAKIGSESLMSELEKVSLVKEL